MLDRSGQIRGVLGLRRALAHFNAVSKTAMLADVGSGLFTSVGSMIGSEALRLIVPCRFLRTERRTTVTTATIGRTCVGPREFALLNRPADGSMQAELSRVVIHDCPNVLAARLIERLNRL